MRLRSAPVLIAVGLIGCGGSPSYVCGAGTMAIGGECVPALSDGGSTAVSCGPGTHLDGNLCLPDPLDFAGGAADLAGTELQPPDLAMADLQMPDLQMPDLQMPDLQMPDLQMPDLAPSCMPTTSVAVVGGEVHAGMGVPASPFAAAFDAVPDPNGATIYFTAVDLNGNAGVFSMPANDSGGSYVAVRTGAPFVAPFGIAISSDGSTLFVADAASREDPTDPSKDRGVLFKMPSAGGSAPTVLVGSVEPRGLTVATSGSVDTLYFTAIDKANGLPGVFTVSPGGGGVTTIAEGAPFADPSGLAVAADGTVYVLDTIAAPSRRANVIVVKGGVATVAALEGNLSVGYPGGITLACGDQSVIVSNIQGTDVLTQFNVGTMAATNFTITGMPVGANLHAAAGLHRAANVATFAFVDSNQDTGDSIYVLR